MPPSYNRLRSEDRRSRLLALGRELFTRHTYDELSMAEISRAAGISKPLLYHYFPSKRRFFEATLRHAADDLLERTRPNPSLEPVEQLRAALDVYLELIDSNRAAYIKLMRSATSAGDVRDLLEEIRARTSERILISVAPGDPPPAMATAVRAWLWFLDGACVDWVERNQLDRAAMRELLVGTLLGALEAGRAATEGPSRGWSIPN